jgi:hypothetical protein
MVIRFANRNIYSCYETAIDKLGLELLVIFMETGRIGMRRGENFMIQMILFIADQDDFFFPRKCRKLLIY